MITEKKKKKKKKKNGSSRWAAMEWNFFIFTWWEEVARRDSNPYNYKNCFSVMGWLNGVITVAEGIKKKEEATTSHWAQRMLFFWSIDVFTRVTVRFDRRREEKRREKWKVKG